MVDRDELEVAVRQEGVGQELGIGGLEVAGEPGLAPTCARRVGLVARGEDEKLPAVRVSTSVLPATSVERAYAFLRCQVVVGMRLRP